MRRALLALAAMAGLALLALALALAIGTATGTLPLPVAYLLGLWPRTGSYTMRGVEVDIIVDEDRVPAFVLPDPLRFEDGRVVRSEAGWRERRVELLSLFSAYVYGRTPPSPKPTLGKVLERDAGALDGNATRIQVRLFVLGDPAGPWMDLLVYLPADVPGPVPLFLGLNFRGNHAIHSDPAIHLAESPVPGGFLAGVRDGRAGPRARGRAASRWPVERLLARGYGVATAYAGDLAPDDPERVNEGVLGALGAGDPRAPDAWGALGAWAFGLSRALDWLAQEPAVDGSRIVAVGHSRLGKAALWAGAQDERFAMVVSNDSGCGGAALSRRGFGENVHAVNALFPHWFAPRFREFGHREDALPVDQHQLLALVAPRPLYVASAEDDLWADPLGERLSAEAAKPVYRLLGEAERVGYHLRPGHHDITGVDWEAFLDFADRQLPPRAKAGASR